MAAIYFRTDGNEEIATGHLMRCLSIARACAALSADIFFLVSDTISERLLEERFLLPGEFSIRCLHSNYREPDLELPALRAILQGNAEETPLLFLDSYFVTKTYLDTLRSWCRTAYLDDLLAFDYPVDLIINYDTTEEPACYHNAAKKLLGAAYTPLRKQFQNISYEVRPQVHDVLLSTGGTDACSVAGKLLEKIYDISSSIENHADKKICLNPMSAKNDANVTNERSALRNLHYHVVTSRLNTHFQELEQLAARYPQIHIHERVQDMASLMAQCDLAISAGGTTLYELCAIGVPTISFATADNQLTAVHTFLTQAALPYAGDARTSLDAVLNAAILFLMENSASCQKRKKSSQNMRAFVDGSGSARIAAALLSLIQS